MPIWAAVSCAVRLCRLQGVVAAEDPAREVERLQLLARVAHLLLDALTGAVRAEGSSPAGRSLQEHHAQARQAGLAAMLQGALDLPTSGGCACGCVHAPTCLASLWQDMRAPAMQITVCCTALHCGSSLGYGLC